MDNMLVSDQRNKLMLDVNESENKSVNAVSDLDVSKKDALPLMEHNDHKDRARLGPENTNIENLSQGVDKTFSKSPTSKGKLKNRQNVKNKEKGTKLKKKNDEMSPKSSEKEKSPKCVNKEKMSKEKVTKLKKKFEDEGKNAQTQSKLFSLFKKTRGFDEMVEPNQPKTTEKSPTEGQERSREEWENTKANAKSDHPENTNAAYGVEYENNYRSDGIRAKEAEMNRRKKLMENKGLLNEENKEQMKRNKNAVLLRRATKKIHRYILNKPNTDNIPSVLGHYPVLISTTFIILFVFLAELVLNKVSFNGRCVSKVLYPEAAINKKPYHVIFGYGACEYNLQQKTETIGFLGAIANDKGWPSHLVSDEAVVESTASFDAPNNRVFNLFGSLDANYIRNYNETFRLFWSMVMHKGLVHVLFNLLAQSQILWIIEPDWGFCRTASTFFLSGLVGNLAAAVFEPSFNVLGSSGCLFGLIASLIPYCIENWTLLASPIYIFFFTLCITIISLLAFNDTVSVYAHFGGWVGGFLWGFATLRSNFNLKDCAIKESLLLSPLFRSKLTPETKSKIRHSYQAKQTTCINKIRLHNKDKSFSKRMKNLLMYPVEYFKRGPYDILIRIVPLTLLVVIVVVLFCYLYIESLYSKMFPLNEQSKLSQCCYAMTKGEGGFTKKVFWCFETYQTAKELCEVKPQPQNT
ncbi:uncharacterized protein TOT_020000554 [Theileria orientalis strain Shintoku]|uniref:Rhomboid-like protease n=1 Tax=Theileria orientalis strain Shintoku TaxID=869250 RepID=J4D7P6_THEOR|nr:uncharacterized protein TOT_020000554 [Theileria orientalis strain Shintoku]BAM40295.1 uncharacterized protein TOT_020000554 [Theileria orientalis strain Shintoku]|eukprot:XP_009690596.1 uncharacterized protein TOT_020000554 [Theileria orientalis strain Shintoku]